MTISIPNLRYAQITQTGIGTTVFTIPTLKTYIFKVMTAILTKPIGVLSRGDIIANINGNNITLFDVWHLDQGAGAYFELQRYSQQIIGSSLIMKAADTVTIQQYYAGNAIILDMGYYILEDDF